MKSVVDDAWIRKTVKEADKAKKDGKQRWKCVRQLQTAFIGRRPARSSHVRKPGGKLPSEPEETRMMWYDHFSRILNRRTEYNQLFIDEMESIPPYFKLDEPPSYDELVKALSKLKQGKAGGRTGILPELLLLGGCELWDRLLLVMEDVWVEKHVVKDWKDAVITKAI